MKNYFRNLFVFGSFLAVFSQNASASFHLLKDSISWQGVKTLSLSENESKQLIMFENAEFIPAFDGLPAYLTKVELKQNEQIGNVVLQNAQYQPLSGAEAKLVKQKLDNHTLQQTNTQISYGEFRGKKLAFIYLLPFKKNQLGEIQKLTTFDLKVEKSNVIASKQLQNPVALASQQYAASSVLATGQWHKISVKKDGVYKIDHTLLSSMGIDPEQIDPRDIRIYGNGGGMLPFANNEFRHDDLQENAIKVVGENDGVFDEDDYILFYAEGPNEWIYNNSDKRFHHEVHHYSDENYYFLTTDLGSGKRVADQASSSLVKTHDVNSFDDFDYHENDNENLIKSGREWYGNKLDILSSIDLNFNFPNLITSTPVYVNTDIAARYDLPYIPNTFSVTANGSGIALNPNATNFGCYSCDYATTASGSFTVSPTGGNITVTVKKNFPSVIGWVNFIEVNAERSLSISGVGNQLLFRNKSTVGVGNVSEFNISNANSAWTVWDVTNPINVKNQLNTLNSGTITFKTPTDSLKTFIAFNNIGYLTPSYVGAVENQNLHASSLKDYIIVCHPNYIEEAAVLANLHQQKDGLSYIIVTPQQIYNEFSSGVQDISAIRNFVKMFYDRANNNPDSIPKYLLLFGDGSYDHKNRFGQNSNFIPTFQSSNSVSLVYSYVSDDFFGLMGDTEGNLDAGGLVDIGIGRIPCRTKSEAQAVVNKILKYTTTGVSLGAFNGSCETSSASPFGSWRNTICFIGDDEDNNLHAQQANSLADGVRTNYPVYNIDKILLDAYVQEATPGGNRYPEVSKAINNRIDQGCLIMNYTGHGGEVGLAHERIVEIPQINAWSNINRLPLLFTATCEFSRYDDPERTSAGELVLTNPGGGAIALMTTVRLVYASPNFQLNQNFYTYAFDTINGGKTPAIGDLFMLTKVASGTNPNHRNFTLLGDPALKLAYPKNNVVNNSISTDTLKALVKVTVTGQVNDPSGNKLAGYNGIIYPTVFDKAITLTTLGNDDASFPMNFTLQKNILYKGKASVTNGDFSFSFVVPKDVAGSSYGAGKISYYAEDGYEDANGYYDSFVVGGTSDTSASDNTGPTVELYMNDENFVFGGITNENPIIYVKLNDEHGINTSGIGIGHDITAVLDENTSQQIVLNDHYEANLDDYKSGTVRYQLSELEEGKHTLKVKAWDVYNNSSESYTEFIVAPDAELALSHVLNYPNPFTTNTSFFFEHNRPCDNLNVQVLIYTVSGKLVKSINTSVTCNGFRADPIPWDGRDDFGEKIGRGVYLYRLKIRSSDNSTAEHIDKLVLLN